MIVGDQYENVMNTVDNKKQTDALSAVAVIHCFKAVFTLNKCYFLNDTNWNLGKILSRDGILLHEEKIIARMF
jgi:hypothetical protein